MHEYSLVQALLSRVEAEAAGRGATKVQRIAVRIGDLAGVERDLFATAFAAFTERTICEGAELEIIAEEARWRCPHCKREIAPGRMLRCPSCAIPAELAAGGELFLDRIQMEVPDV